MSETGFNLDHPEKVADIQRKLACLGLHAGPRSGTFDEATRVAIKAFQRKHKLDPTGVCDETTWYRLDDAAGSLWSETFQYELTALRGVPPDGVRPAAESEVVQNAHAQCLAGLAFSGGGIRSATFNLGILQALAENKLLRDFDYLSTVSGGGYIGAWFSKWLKEQNGVIADAEAHLTPGSKAHPVVDEPDQIKFLRQYSNYLTPKTGMFSADTWSVIATYLRNTMLNLTILIALLAAFLVLPRGLTWLVQNHHAEYGLVFLWVALVAFLWVVYSIALGISLTPDPASKNQVFSQTQGSVLRRIVVPLMLAGFAGSIGLWEVRLPVRAAWAAFGEGLRGADGTSAIAYLWGERIRIFEFAILPGIIYFLVWLAGWGTAQYRNRLPDDPPIDWKDIGREGLGHLLFAILALALGSLLVLISVVWVGRWLEDADQSDRYSQLVAFGMPFLLAIFGITMVLLVGLIGRLYTDGSREWWSREGGWAIICVLAWLALFLVAFYIPPLLFWANAHASNWVGAAVASTWLGTTLAGVLAGAGKSTGKSPAKPWIDFLAQIAPYIFTVGIVVAVSTLVHLVVTPNGANGVYLGPDAPLVDYLESYLVAVESTKLSTLALALSGFLIVGLVLAWRVDINKFSLYMMYRNRLVRAYLGASSKNRRPHPFTAFDGKDDPRLEELYKPDQIHVQKPYHIINAALNLVKGKELAWQTRKASGFVFTPAFCGYEMPSMPLAGGTQSEQHAARGCYRPTAQYGARRNRINDEDEGTKLGMAVAVSGAAVSPSMGYHSSPPLAFLMTIFNVRLGRWCANPRSSTQWKNSGPRIGLFCLIAELFGLTDADADFVYLSDGGHFENLGIYELVRRRCRLIVVVDAGADGKMNFEDLGNAIRKCYTDLRVEIEIDVGRIDRKRNALFSKAYCVAGTVRYGKVDRNAPDGTLLYIKPSLTGDELADVLNYRKSDPDFPHQSTTDQWFDETQFESYRSLGYRIGSVALRKAAETSVVNATPTQPMRHDIAALCAGIDEQWKRPRPEATPPLAAKATD
ncbi:MAG: peptidoglycan-binding protein [Betaproteobacteria bacterium]